MQIFIIGINGISMQGIAYIMQKEGHQVYGFDDNNHKLPNIQYHDQIPNNTDIIVYSSAIKETHPLRIQAKEKKIESLQRTDFFIKYMPQNTNKILIAGAHGKTTTSSIIAYMLGLESYYLGGIINHEPSSAKFTKTAEYTVIETDESDASFLKWQGKYKILLNFDYEHMAYYQTKNKIENAYYQFAMQNIENSKLIIYKPTKNFLNIPNHKNIITYGTSDSDYYITNIKGNKHGVSFSINNQNFSIPMLGLHNAYNFTAIYALFQLINKPIDKIHTFPGIKKRMQPIQYKNHTKKFFLDYGHHPNEIQSVLNSLTQHFPEKFAIIIEPHKPSRILSTLKQWPEILKNHKIFLYQLFIADEAELNRTIQFSTEKFFHFLKNHNINVTLLNKNLENLPLNQYNLICFSAGELSEKLSKY